MYIDIIMQKKRPLNTDVPEDEDEPVIIESDIDSQKLEHTLHYYTVVVEGCLEFTTVECLYE